MRKMNAKWMKIFAAMIFVMAVTIITGRELTAEAAAGTGTSTYYYNLQKDTRSTFAEGTEVFLTKNSGDFTNTNYISYVFPRELSAAFEIASAGSYKGAHCSICATNNANVAGLHYHIRITTNGGNFDQCNGCITYVSDNQWKYNCYGGAYSNTPIYLYTCQKGTFSASDVTVNYKNGEMTGATIFAGTPGAFTVPADMINISGNVNYQNGDYTQTAKLGDVTITAVDSNAVFDAKLKNVNLSKEDADAIKALLANAGSNADVERILAQAQALEAVDTDAAKAKAAINAMSNLTADEKNAKINAINNAVKIAKSNILSATNTGAVTSALENGQGAIALVEAKAKAMSELVAAANEQKNVIDTYEYLTPEEKTQMKAEVDAAVASAKTAIENATTLEQVTDAKNAGNTAVDLIQYKANVIHIGRGYRDRLHATIDALPNLTPDEKTAMKNKVNDTISAYEAEVKNAANRAGVLDAVSKLNKAGELIKAQAQAMDAINEDAAAKIAEINALTHLTQEQKDALISELESAKTATFEAINATTEKGEIASIKTKALACNRVKVEEAKALDTVMAQKALTAEEQKAFADRLKESAAKAVADITAADPSAVDFENTMNGIVDAMVVEAGDIADDAVALNFVKSYVAGKDGEVYSEINSKNADQILSGKTAWTELTDEQKAKVDALIAEANKDIADAPQSYEAFAEATEEFIAASAEDFIQTYLTGKDGKLFKKADASNYKQILSGLKAWNKLSQSEKDAINAKLTANGGKTYEELIKRAKEVEHYIKTGDSSKFVLWISLMIISLAAVLYIPFKKRMFASK